MASVETVQVIRKDHPDGHVTINKSDLTKDDVVKGQKAERKPNTTKAK